MIRRIELPPAIEMRVMSERKLVERLLFKDIQHYEIDYKYTEC
jgi:hypothetical protein